MVIDTKRLYERLIERNPNAPFEDIVSVVSADMENDPKLRKAIVRLWVERAYPIAQKIAKGEKLTAEEMARAAELGYQTEPR